MYDLKFELINLNNLKYDILLYTHIIVNDILQLYTSYMSNRYKNKINLYLTAQNN